MEAGLAVGFGAADAAITKKVTGTGPGKIPWSVYFEAAGIALGFFGGTLGLGADVRDPVLISSLALAGQRATRYAMAGVLTNPAGWAGAGGDGGDGGPYFPAGGASVPSFRASGAGRSAGRLGRGGYPVQIVAKEAGGVAG
jgi:hypothetical protein